MDKNWRYVACPTCRQMGFDVIQHIDTGEVLIECRSCRAVLLRSAPPPTLQPTMQAASGHAPADGPYRP